MARTKVSGKMDRNWLQKIGKSSKITDTVRSTWQETKHVAEANIDILGYRTGEPFYHYGGRRPTVSTSSTVWGATGTIWAESPMARTRLDSLDDAAETVDLRLNKRR